MKLHLPRRAYTQTEPTRALVVASDSVLDRAKTGVAGGAIAGIGVAVDAMTGVPMLGGILAGALVGWVPNAKLDRVCRLAEALAVEVEQVKDRIDQDFVTREEFVASFEDVLDRVTRQKNDEKLAYFAAALAQTATVDRIKKQERERLLDLLDDLRPSNLSVLAALSSAKGAPKPRSRPPYTPALAAWDALMAATADADTEDVEQDLADLQRRGLVLALDNENVIVNATTGIEKVLTPLAWRLIGFGALQTVSSRAKCPTRKH